MISGSVSEFLRLVSGFLCASSEPLAEFTDIDGLKTTAAGEGILNALCFRAGTSSH
jgi:hypothetical protein